VLPEDSACTAMEEAYYKAISYTLGKFLETVAHKLGVPIEVPDGMPADVARKTQEAAKLLCDLMQVDRDFVSEQIAHCTRGIETAKLTPVETEMMESRILDLTVLLQAANSAQERLLNREERAAMMARANAEDAAAKGGAQP
jgi:hypothetical protein